jgi:putative DNA primase/helicase
MSTGVMTASAAWSDALEQLTRFGLIIDHLACDGVLHRTPHRDDRPGRKNGWYVAHEYVTTSGRALIVGAFGWWKEGDTVHKLRHDTAGLSYDEQQALAVKRQELEAAAKAARQALASEAARRAQAIWPGLAVEGHSPYLQRKQAAAFGVRFARGSVVVPLRTGPADTDLVGLQWISPDGTKRLLTGTAKRGAYGLLGAEPGPGDWVAIGEGYVTCASVCMAMGWSGVFAVDAGNLLEVAKTIRRQYPGSRLVILADDDHATRGNPGIAKATAAARATQALLAVPRFASTTADRGTDWNDLHVTEGLPEVTRQLQSLVATASPSTPARPAVIQGHFPNNDWRGLLQRNTAGAILPTSYNTRVILQHDPAWQGVLGFCEFSHTIQKRELPPYEHAARGEWEDADDANLRFWLAQRYAIEPKGVVLSDAVTGAALASSYHPVRDYLDGLRWDGVPRLYRWLVTYLGAGGAEHLPHDERNPNTQRYLELVGTYYLIQSVSRVRAPGRKADTVLILEGPQGKGKSTALSVLFGQAWFSDTPIDIGSKDAYEAIRGLWCIELAELDSLNKADATRAKAFFSSHTDRFRLPYGHRAKSHVRQCVIAGTTNHQAHLKDYTGNRRFWSVSTGAIDLDALARDRDQLWAEADHRFRQGETWWVQEEDAHLFTEQQDARLDADVWETVIAAWLEERLAGVMPDARPLHTVTAADIMRDALKIDLGSMKRPEQTRVGLIMGALDWRACRLGRGAQRTRGYRPTALYLRRLEAKPTPNLYEPWRTPVDGVGDDQGHGYGGPDGGVYGADTGPGATREPGQVIHLPSSRPVEPGPTF